MSSTEVTEPANTSPVEDPAPRRGVSIDLLGGIALLAIAAVFLLKAGEGSKDWLMPVSLGWGVVAVGVVLVVRGVLGHGERVDLVPPLLRGEGRDVSVFLALTVTYVVLVRPVGFWAMSFLNLFVASFYLSAERSRRDATVSVGVAAGVTVVAFLLLTQVFYVPLPKARWWPF